MSSINGSCFLGCSGQEDHDGGRVIGDHVLDFGQTAALLVNAINFDEVGVLDPRLVGKSNKLVIGFELGNLGVESNILSHNNSQIVSNI